MKTGKVYLVGAGPGDPGLITVKGKECIQKSEVLIYDYLASPDLLKYASKSAQLIYVGKKGGDHTLAQARISELLVAKAKTGAVVTRLKGGDPFIFGRGGEEAEELAAAGVAFEIVPGVTSAVAAPAYAGIPVTHRRFTSTVAFITGHEDPGKEESSIDWSCLAKGIGTLVFFMGVKNLPDIMDQLIRHGLPPDRSVAVVRWGTTAAQVTVTGTAADIVERVRRAGLKAPAIIVVGDVVRLRETLQWFETRPLWGKRIVVTRSREQASDLVRMLTELGADCVECPTIEIVAPEDSGPLDQAIANLAAYDWLVFTSANAVSRFFERLFDADRDLRALHRIRTAAIGPATANRLFEFGLRSDIVPDTYRAESVVDAFRNQQLSGKRILLPRAKEARPVLPAELAKMGARVDEVAVYETRSVPDNADMITAQLSQKRIDLVTFTSSSTVRNFKALIPTEIFESLMRGVPTASIGPITAETAAELGFEVTIVAETYTIPDLCEAILRHYHD
jgi:uroporphyrinogen III methyltransferase/synthase